MNNLFKFGNQILININYIILISNGSLDDVIKTQTNCT